MGSMIDRAILAVFRWRLKRARSTTALTDGIFRSIRELIDRESQTLDHQERERYHAAALARFNELPGDNAELLQ